MTNAEKRNMTITLFAIVFNIRSVKILSSSYWELQSSNTNRYTSCHIFEWSARSCILLWCILHCQRVPPKLELSCAKKNVLLCTFRFVIDSANIWKLRTAAANKPSQQFGGDRRVGGYPVRHQFPVAVPARQHLLPHQYPADIVREFDDHRSGAADAVSDAGQRSPVEFQSVPSGLHRRRSAAAVDEIVDNGADEQQFVGGTSQTCRRWNEDDWCRPDGGRGRWIVVSKRWAQLFGRSI